ncbi:stalk domain-containing protein [Brevibacillus ginsengisoli]|uniref:stalk domain-containing protein n=1 Tax=Brevibacillus ginsengisoli TaxID=363854 RepID=UPI003CF93641
MAKRKLAAILVSLSLLVAIPTQAQTVKPQAQPIPLQLKMDNQVVHLMEPLQSYHQRTMISLNDLATLVHGTTSKSNGIFTLTVNSTEIDFDPKSNEIRLGGRGSAWTKIDQGAVQVSGSTVLVPLRFVFENLGYKVAFDQTTRMISIEPKGELDVFKSVKLEELTADEKEFVEENRRVEGIHQKGDLIVIARGEVPNPGHGIEFVEQKGGWEQVSLYVELTKPEPGKMYPQVISYPYLVGKMKLAPYTTVTVVNSKDRTVLFQNKKTK